MINLINQNKVKGAFPTFSESLKGVAARNFPGGYAPRPPYFLLSGPPQTSSLDPPLCVGHTQCLGGRAQYDVRTGTAQSEPEM